MCEWNAEECDEINLNVLSPRFNIENTVHVVEQTHKRLIIPFSLVTLDQINTDWLTERQSVDLLLVFLLPGEK